MATTTAQRQTLNLNFYLQNNVNVDGSKLIKFVAKNKKNQVGMRTIKSYTNLNELEKLSDHYSINEAEKSDKSEKSMLKVEEQQLGKSLVIETFEKRVEFYDDDVSPVIGYILVAFSVILLIVGANYILGECLLLKTNLFLLTISKQIFIHVPIFIVLNAFGVYANWLSYKFIKHT